MSELDTEARSAGNAAITALRSALDSAENRIKWAVEVTAVAQRHREAAIREVADLKQALAVLRRGDGHGG
jgi:hypothetical protein